MTVIAYLLDENVNTRLHTALQRGWPALVVRRVGDPDAPLLGTADPEILRWCEINGMSLVTNNRRSMPRHLRDHLLAGRHVPGIFLLPRGLTIGDVAERLALISGASDAAEYRDQLAYLAQIT